MRAEWKGKTKGLFRSGPLHFEDVFPPPHFPPSGNKSSRAVQSVGLDPSLLGLGFMASRLQLRFAFALRVVVQAIGSG